MSRVGITFGKLTVLEDTANQLLCRCECGREGIYPSALSKPTYRGRRQCAHCAGRPCEVCGKWIEAKPGRQSPTCSPSCRKKRANQREKDRYRRIKNTPEWKSVRAAYLAAVKDRIAGDPEFAEIYRAYRRKVVAESIARTNRAPEKREAFLQKKRQAAAEWRAALHANPALHAEHLAASRAWYKSLSDEERERIFYAPRRERLNQIRQAEFLSVAAELEKRIKK